MHHQSESPRAPVSPPAVGLTLFPVSSDSSRQQKYDVIHRLPPHIPFPPLLDADWSARFFSRRQQQSARQQEPWTGLGSAILVLLTSLFVFDNGQRAECRSGGRAVRDRRWVVRGACCANTESWRKKRKAESPLQSQSPFLHLEGQCNKTVFAMLLMQNIVGKLYNKV